MKSININDLVYFLAIARAGSFTKAAAQLGVSQSALSHTMRSLEERLGLRLLMRTTRSVSPTEAGQRLLQNLGPRLDEIEQDIEALSELRDKPTGTIRITCGEHPAHTILWPKLDKFLRNYPDVKVEIIIEQGMTDIAAQGYDAGIRFGEQVAQDMIAVRIGPDARMAVVASPSYFKKRQPPLTPQDLIHHTCINLRLPTHGGLYAWEFEKDKREINVRVKGQLVFNSSSLSTDAALKGFGLAYLPEAMVEKHIERKRLVRVLEDWCPPFSGFHLYYPSRRQSSPAFSLFIETLRYSSK